MLRLITDTLFLRRGTPADSRSASNVHQCSPLDLPLCLHSGQGWSTHKLPHSPTPEWSWDWLPGCRFPCLPKLSRCLQIHLMLNYVFWMWKKNALKETTSGLMISYRSFCFSSDCCIPKAKLIVWCLSAEVRSHIALRSCWCTLFAVACGVLNGIKCKFHSDTGVSQSDF